ncbi:Leucyl aminopeptidase yscIV [Cadophora gregata]|uniref:Leucyl aminopeptidase yscIV n=1 Tax=Cadophora gregata TaxID=51156 RepID=UPI0026DB30F5|nr:Leucyl aminopeptidase yscIV [Cadophora gregata]KAK0123988.1 Leucyl aminopeptidase yscIV [Cadophora gregata]KAK0130327.1 Leucyl aminopeptidase yscIV [Cadophora gregata f. sp. sojae]
MMKSIQTLVAFGALASTALAALPLVESNKLRRVLLRSELVKKSETLLSFADDNTRRAATSGHNKTVDWIVDTLSAYPDYYDVEVQPFTMPGGKAVFSANGQTLLADYMIYSPEGSVSAPMVLVNNLGCDAADFPAAVAGSIAFIKRGTCPFGSKVALAGSAGAVGTIIYNNVVVRLADRTLEPQETHPEGPFQPAAGVSDTVGATLLSLLGAGPVTASLSIDLSDVTSYNVIAQTKGGDQNNVLHVGGHSDSVIDGPGINDNGSGSIALLEIAIQLTKYSVNNAIRFSWWSGEEQGEIGSYYYVDSLSPEELAKIRLYLNFDMIASPNYYYAIYDGDGSSFGTAGAPGSAQAEKLFEDFFQYEEHLPFASTAFDGRSDYGPFLEVGVPCGGLFTGAEQLKTEEEAALFGGTAGVAYDVNYHSAKDDVKNLNIGAFLHNAKAIAHSVATYGISWEGKYGVPARTKRDIITRKQIVSRKSSERFTF